MKRLGALGALGALWRAIRGSWRPDEPGLGERVRSVPRLFWAVATRRYRGTRVSRLLAMVVALVYVVSPIDLLPELFLPIVGLIDDAVVVAWLAAAVLVETERFLRWEREGPAADGPDVVVGHVVRGR